MKESGIPDEDLNGLLNGWPEGTVGHQIDGELITTLNQLGKKHGYGRLHQVTEAIEDLWRHPQKKLEYQAIHDKRMEILGGNVPEMLKKPIEAIEADVQGFW